MFRKTKLSSAVVIALATTVSATMLTGLTGCKLTEGGTSITGGQASTITNPKGTVVGNVQDTNGNPLAGVEVYLAGKKVKTDMGGNYRFNNVGVVNSSGTGDNTANDQLLVSVVPEAGYLGATVTVRPEAQFNNNGDIGGGSVNPVTTFVDGFLAQAGTAVLPALEAVSSGVLRDNNTGEPLPNQLIALDMVRTGTGVGQEETQDTPVSTSYATYNYTTTTDADGNFTFTGLPNDSVLRVVISMYNVNQVSANNSGANQIVTTNENADVWHGNVFVTEVTALDNRTPYVTAVVEVTSALTNPGPLHDDVTNTITVNFSEAMNGAMIDANSVKVIDFTTNTWLTATATLAADGKSMTIVSTTDFVAGNEIHVHMLLADFQDMGGNTITTDQTATNAPAPGNRISYDFFADAGAATTADGYLELQVMQYAEANDDAQAVTNFAQLMTDDSGTDDNAMYQAASNAFNDTRDEDGTGGIQQVNDQDDIDGINGHDTARRLQQLLAEQGGAGQVLVNVARLSFTSSNAASYTIDVNSAGVDVPAAVVASRINNESAEMDFPGGALAANQFTITDATGDIGLSLSQATIGDIVTITPYDDFGYAGTATSVTIADNVNPRTVLQNSYGETLGADHDGVVVSTFGDGGEQSQIGSENVGVPYLGISAGLLDNLGTNGDPLDGTNATDDNNLNEELAAHNTIDETNCGSAVDACIAKGTGIYDANAWTAFSGNLARTVGISMSEDVTLSGTPAAATTVALSNWLENNDVTIQDDGGDSGVGTLYNVVDLVQFDAADVIALANNDAGTEIDFAGVITDNAGNTADAATNAKVVIRDAMPPMVTSASYNGTHVTITFNEDIAPAVGDTIGLNAGPGLTVTQNVVDAHAAATDKTQLVFDMTDVAVTAGPGDDNGYYADINQTANVTLGAYAEVTAGAVLEHFEIDFSDIDDASADGNKWANEGANLTTPTFAGTSTIDAAVVTNNTASANWAIGTATNVATSFTFTFTSTHAIDMNASFGVAGDETALTGAEVAAAFTLTDASGSAIDGTAAGTAATLSTDRKTLTVTVVVDAGGTALAALDTFAPNAPIVSDFDGSQSETAANLTDTL